MIQHLTCLFVLVSFGQSQNQCVREIRSLKDDIQDELRDVVRNTITATDQSVSREEVQELIEDKATKDDVLVLRNNLTAGNRLFIDILAANQNVTLEELDQIIGDMVTKEDFQAIKESVIDGNQHTMDTLLALIVTNNVTRNKLVGLLSDKATNEDVRRKASEVVGSLNTLNVSVVDGNRHIIETLAKIVDSQDEIKNATTLNNITQAEQCVTTDEVRDIIRADVASVVQTEVQATIRREVAAIVHTEVQSVVQAEIRLLTGQIISEIQTNTAQLLLALTLNTQEFYNCNGKPGWRRVVFINMTDTSYNCPPGLNLTSYSKRTCGRAHSVGQDCSSTTFSVRGFEYSQVCGRIRGYQVGATLAFLGHTLFSSSINDQYVDGVSLTHGDVGKREHIWTIAAGLTQTQSSPPSQLCPCDTSDVDSPPFVGDDYFCESGTDTAWTGSGFHGVFFPNNPLWDGQGCTSTSPCCQFNNPPWFTKNLPNPTIDDIELRLCLANNIRSSDVPLELIELYVQ